MSGFICVSAARAAMSDAVMILPIATPQSTFTPPVTRLLSGYDPPEGWGWCYVDRVTFDLSNRMTPHNGPIPRFI